MKVPRSYVGKYVELVWRDPVAAFRSRNPVAGYPERIKLLGPDAVGLEALASWTERGLIVDVTDGIVKIEHSVGEDPPLHSDRNRDTVCTWTHEALVESIRVFEPVGEKVTG